MSADDHIWSQVFQVKNWIWSNIRKLGVPINLQNEVYHECLIECYNHLKRHPRDASKGKLTTWTWFPIMNAYNRYQSIRYIVRFPAHVIEKVNIARKAEVSLINSLGRQPTIEEIAEECNLDPQILNRAINAINERLVCQPKSKRDTDDSNPLPIVETIIPSDISAPDEVVFEGEISVILDKSMGRILPQYGKLLKELYYENSSISEIATREGCSQQVICARRLSALRMLRKELCYIKSEGGFDAYCSL